VAIRKKGSHGLRIDAHSSVRLRIATVKIQTICFDGLKEL
jgi:hypothetical protein